MPQEIRLSVRGLTLAGLHWPRVSSIKVLALHGWLDNAASFSELAPQLDCEIVALDLPSHGLSQHRPMNSVIHYVDYMVDIHQVIKQLGWDKVVLLGHSMGAGLSSVYASAFAVKVQALICIDGLGPITAGSESLPGRLNKSVRLHAAFKSGKKTVYEKIEQAISARLQAGDLSEKSARILVERNLIAIDEGYTWRSDPRLLLPSLYYLSEEQATAYLAQITAPTLMVRAAQSGLFEDAFLKRRAKLVDNLVWQEVPGGHHVHLDNAGVVAPVIKAFLQTI